MKIILTYALAIGFAGTSAMLVQRDMATRRGQSVDAQMAGDAAYRDGIYLRKTRPHRQESDASPDRALVDGKGPRLLCRRLSPRLRRLQRVNDRE